MIHRLCSQIQCPQCYDIPWRYREQLLFFEGEIAKIYNMLLDIRALQVDPYKEGFKGQKGQRLKK